MEKNKEPPVAKEDGEYPVWLWGLLGKREGEGEGEEGKGVGDAFCGFLFFFPTFFSPFHIHSRGWTLLGLLWQLGVRWVVISDLVAFSKEPMCAVVSD